MSEPLYTADELGRAAREVAMAAALFLIREHGDGEIAIEALAQASIPVEGGEVLDAAGLAAQAIREALDMGVVPR